MSDITDRAAIAAAIKAKKKAKKNAKLLKRKQVETPIVAPVEVEAPLSKKVKKDKKDKKEKVRLDDEEKAE